MTNLKAGDRIETIDELEDLPVGSVVRTQFARVAVKADRYLTKNDSWFETGEEFEIYTDELDDFPHLLLYVGGEQ